MRSASKTLGGNSRRHSSAKRSVNAPSDLPRDHTINTCWQGWAGTYSVRSSRRCPRSTAPSSRPGSRVQPLSRTGQNKTVPHLWSTGDAQAHSVDVQMAPRTWSQTHAAEWAERLTQHDEEPLWKELQVLQSHQYQGWAFTLDATPSTYDLRSQLWVFGLCVHVLSTGQLQRLGAITGVPEHPQTKTSLGEGQSPSRPQSHRWVAGLLVAQATWQRPGPS